MNPKRWLFLFVFITLLVACQNNATPVAEVNSVPSTASATDTPKPVPTDTPVPPTVEPTATNTPEPTATATAEPTATSTLTPSPTPLPSASVTILDETSGEPVNSALVQLTGRDVMTMTEATTADGTVTFTELTTGTLYTVTITATGYVEMVTTLDVSDGVNDLAVNMHIGYLVGITPNSAYLRSGPGTMYDTIGVVEAGDVLQVVGRNDDGEWLVVQTADGEEGWLAASLIDEEIDPEPLTAIAAPPTPVPQPTSVAAATATPDVPSGSGTFDGVALRDTMVNVRWILEQMGGLLDRLVNGSTESCNEYMDYYFQLIASPTYETVPPEWQGVYNEYAGAVYNVLTTNDGVASLCLHGGGVLNQQAYGTGRQGINISLDRLNPAIVAANGLLGQ